MTSWALQQFEFSGKLDLVRQHGVTITAKNFLFLYRTIWKVRTEIQNKGITLCWMVECNILLWHLSYSMAYKWTRVYI